MERWYVMMKKADFSSIGAKYNISPVIARLIRNRDIIEDEEINLYEILNHIVLIVFCVTVCI